MKAAVTVIGWLAAATIGGWLAWCAVSHPSGMDSDPLTATLGTILLLAWTAGAIVVWWSPWLAALVFALAAALTPEHELPVTTLLMAVSAALAVWSLLADLASTLHRGSQEGTDTDNDRTMSPAAEQPMLLKPCVICQRPTGSSICAACRVALGPHAEAWLTGTGRRAGRPVPAPPPVVDEHHS
jgi:hypothetical protein